MNFSQIINRFFYRDLVYIFSGSILLFYFGYINNGKSYGEYLNQIISLLKDNSTNILLIFLLGGIAYICALFSQVIFRFFLPTKIFKSQKVYQDKIEQLFKKNIAIHENLERIIFLKQIGTTLGSSLILSFIFYIIRLIKIINTNKMSESLNEIICTAFIFIISIYACIHLNKNSRKQEKDILD